MGKKEKDQQNGAPLGQDESEARDDEKLFDFDKANPEDAMAGNESGENGGKVTELQASVNELKDKQLRLLAEFENYKKRTTRERLELMSSASKDVILALLPILDDFDRAKKSADDPETGEHFSEGVNLVYHRLSNTLQSLGLKVMDSTNQPFDPDMHDAITEIQVPTEELKGKVIDTIEKGYLLNDKIIRHAKVVVGK